MNFPPVFVTFAAAFSLLSATVSAAPVITVDMAAPSTVTVSKNLYGINVARWDDTLFPGETDEQLLTANRPAIKRLVEMKPAFLKYPGGGDANTYVWNSKDNPASDMDSAEFMSLCRACNAPGFITVNFSESPELAANWVREMKKYSDAGGQPVPWWEVGDEIWGRWAKGHTTGDKYATGFNKFVKVMKQADPDIKMVADLAISAPDTTWTRQAMSIIEECDLYTCTWFAQYSEKEDDQQLLHSISTYSGLYANLKNFVNEQRAARGLPPAQFCLVGFNSVDFHPGPQTVEMVNAVFMARMFTELASSGIDMAAWWAYRNPWPERGGDYGLVASDDNAAPYYTYHVFKLLSEKFWGSFIGKGMADNVEWSCVKSDNGDLQLLLSNLTTEPVRDLTLELNNAASTLTLSANDVVTSASAGEVGPAQFPTVLSPTTADGNQLLEIPELPGYGVALITLTNEAADAAKP